MRRAWISERTAIKDGRESGREALLEAWSEQMQHQVTVFFALLILLGIILKADAHRHSPKYDDHQSLEDDKYI